MGLREVLILTDDDDGSCPEVLRLVLVMLLEPSEHVVALSNVHTVPMRNFGVRADEEVDACPFDFRTLGQGRELGSRRYDDLAGPVDDLRGEDASGNTIHEVNTNRLTVHNGVCHWSDSVIPVRYRFTRWCSILLRFSPSNVGAEREVSGGRGIEDGK
jgi:hypothetical protein